MSTEENTVSKRLDAARILGYVRIAVYSLATLLALSLLATGAIGLIAEIKGSWHWQIHLQSTISYMGIFTSRLLVILVPLFVLLVVGRQVVSDV